MSGHHTPGPWDVQNKGNLYGSSARHEVVAGDNRLEGKPLPTICKMPGLAEKDYANARLIAAAPDLLAALRKLDEWHDLIRQDYPEMYPAFRDARAAIAKAEGRS